MNEFVTIDSTDLHNVNGGNRARAIVKGAQAAGRYAGKAAKWTWNEVIKPGLVWAGAESLINGGGQQQQQPAQQQK